MHGCRCAVAVREGQVFGKMEIQTLALAWVEIRSEREIEKGVYLKFHCCCCCWY